MAVKEEQMSLKPAASFKKHLKPGISPGDSTQDDEVNLLLFHQRYLGQKKKEPAGNGNKNTRIKQYKQEFGMFNWLYLAWQSGCQFYDHRHV